MAGQGQGWAIAVALRYVVPEPVLTGFVALHNRMPGSGSVAAAMPGWGSVTTTDVAAPGAPTKVKPPPSLRLALDAAGSARRHCGVDQNHVHR